MYSYLSYFAISAFSLDSDLCKSRNHFHHVPLLNLQAPEQCLQDSTVWVDEWMGGWMTNYNIQFRILFS